MQITTVKLPQENAYLDIYHSTSTVPLPGIVIVPGGSYNQIKERDSERVAITLATQAFESFVVRYPVLEHKDYQAAKRAVAQVFDYIIDHAISLSVDIQRLGVLGFSAGGQLAAAYSCLPGSHARFAALGYPVIQPLIDDQMGVTTENVATLVSSQTPPTFIWGSINDDLTPYLDHVNVYVTALAKHGVPFELHEFATGNHGMALANRYTSIVNRDRVDKHLAKWFPLFLEWFAQLG